MQVYAGTFLIAFATLALEITLTRLLSVTTWYHLAFFAVATAMLGMTAGATRIYLDPDKFSSGRIAANLTSACLGFALSIPLTVSALCLIPIPRYVSFMTLVALILIAGVCSMPFYFSGIAVTLVLTKHPFSIGKLYASDLVGASFGCLFVLAGFELMDAPSLALLCGAIGALGSWVFLPRPAVSKLISRQSVIFAILLFATAVNSSSAALLRPVAVKGSLESPTEYLYEKWNSFSRVVVSSRNFSEPQYWGPAKNAPRDPIHQHGMNIDGAAGTVLRRFMSIEDIEHLRFDVTNIGYYLRPKGGACIIGVGGGRDIQSALLFGHEQVTGIEINPTFIELHRSVFRGFSGLSQRANVDLIIDEARSYLYRSQDKYAILQMSLIDTLAATGAGAFTLSENSLYTIEAWEVFTEHLEDQGIFTVSRWYSPVAAGESGRLLSLAVATLLKKGISEPQRNILLVTAGSVATLLLKMEPFKGTEIRRIKRASKRMGFNLTVSPEMRPDNPILASIMAARSLEDLYRPQEEQMLRLDPPSDEDPYFFNMLRLGHLGEIIVNATPGGVIWGNLMATATLCSLILSLFILTVATILVPLLAHTKGGERGGPRKVLWSGAVYFSAIGAGFMLLEIALIQRLSVFLGHPIYALGILLFTIILSTGIGSYLSERVKIIEFPKLMFLLPLVAVCAILGVRVILNLVIDAMIVSPVNHKIFASIALLFPIGIIMGFFFPTGMHLVRSVRAAETPWYWALNGIFGVLCSALAVFFSIFYGISMNFYIAAGCYTLLLICIPLLYLQAQNRGAVSTLVDTLVVDLPARTERIP